MRFETEPSEKSGASKLRIDLNNLKVTKSSVSPRNLSTRRRNSIGEERKFMTKKQPGLIMTLLGDKEIDHDVSDGVSMSNDSSNPSNNLATTEDSGKLPSNENDGSSG